MPSERCSWRSSTWSCSRSLRSRAPSGSSSKQDLGLEHERARERHPLLLAARELARPPAAEALEADQAERIVDPAAGLGLAEAAHRERKGDVGGDRHVREQRVALEHEADVALGRRQPGDVAAADLDPSGRRAAQTRDHGEERGLARAARAEHGHELALRDREVDVLDRDHRPVALGDADQIDRAHGRPSLAEHPQASYRRAVGHCRGIDRTRTLDFVAGTFAPGRVTRGRS